MMHRRDVLKFVMSGAGTSVLLSSPASAQPAANAAASPAPQPAPAQAPHPVAGPDVPLAPPLDFKPSTPVELARQLAKTPFKAINTDLPDPFKNLSYERYMGIAFKPELQIWSKDKLGFTIEPLHRGFEYANPIEINLVENGKSYRLVYEPRLFDFGKVGNPGRVGDIGFSGFRIMRPAKTGMQELVTFQGTNFFRALADGQVPGLMTRALAVKIADPKGEEIPYFRQIWIEKPDPVAGLIVVHAVIDSESVTGAFRFTIRPGSATIIDTECTLFARVDLDNFGLASMSATHLLGFIDHKRFDDYRPNVCEVGGLQLLTGASEWVWRPVSNRGSLQVSTFVDKNPKGFGCLLRDRDFENYLDFDQRWEKRPSLWIEPLGDWDEGGVQLIEIPSQSEANDNILCFWRPKKVLKGGSESAFAYRQFWCWDPPQQPDLARAKYSHAGNVGRRSRFFVEFRGDILGDAARTDGLAPTLTATAGSLTMVKTSIAPDRKAYRVLFELDPQNAGASELRLVLEAKGQRVSETWLYRWTSE